MQWDSDKHRAPAVHKKTTAKQQDMKHKKNLFSLIKYWTSAAICWPTMQNPFFCRNMTPTSLLPLPPPHSDGESPSNHSHLIRADVGGRSHDVPQPPHSDVRLHAGADRRGSAQRLLPGQPDHAGPGHRWSRRLDGELPTH